MSAPEQVQVSRAIELWFFRDISDEQRRALIGLTLGEAVAGEATNHSWQRLCLKRILRHTTQSDLLAAMREAAEALKPFAFAAAHAPKIGKKPHDFVLTSEFDAASAALAKLTAAIDQMGGG
jgi:hypothetical protein